MALEKAKQAIAAMSRDAALAVIFQQATASDEADIVPGVRPDHLGKVELWQGRDPPALVGQRWETLKEQLRFAPEGWDVWIDRYEARLDGRLRSQKVELAFVNYIRNVSPAATVGEANSEIKRLIELASPNLRVPTATSYLTAGAASFSVGDILSARVVISAAPPARPPPIESIPFNVYVIGDPRGLELDRIRLGPQDREAARKIATLAAPIARAAAEAQSPATPAAQEALSEQVDAAIDAPDGINGDQAAELARKTAGNFVSELLRRAYAPIQKLGRVVTGETKVALKEYRAAIYRGAGTGTFAGLSAGAYLCWPEISSFIVRNADALRAFAIAAYQIPCSSRLSI